MTSSENLLLKRKTGKRFNIAGTCIPSRHYMADTTRIINAILPMIAEGEYFTINRPRQFGKTTTIELLEKKLKDYPQFLVLNISFEGIDANTYKEPAIFVRTFLEIIRDQLLFLGKNEVGHFVGSHIPATTSMTGLSRFITELIKTVGVENHTILMVDEVDKSCNNQLFLDFLGMLRTKYLKRSTGKDFTFHSVVLAGVHDVKTLKTKIRDDGGGKFNSPWNIAVNFNVELCFNAAEIVPMLNEYAKAENVDMDAVRFADRIYYYTSGYPFLVSALCKIISETLLPKKYKPKHIKASTDDSGAAIRKQWEDSDLEAALQLILKEKNTNFDSLIKNLEANGELYDFVFDIIMNGAEFSYNPDNPAIETGIMYGIFRDSGGKLKIHNRIYEQRIYNYMASRLETSRLSGFHPVGAGYVTAGGGLDVRRVIRKFQDFMKEQYSRKDTDFIERNGRLLFLAFLKPIINGKGFDVKEVQVSEEKRLDIVVTFGGCKYIIELKKWRGESYHRQGIEQLCHYLDIHGHGSGYLLIFDLRKETGRSGQVQSLAIDDKTIFTAWV